MGQLSVNSCKTTFSFFLCGEITPWISFFWINCRQCSGRNTDCQCKNVELQSAEYTGIHCKYCSLWKEMQCGSNLLLPSAYLWGLSALSHSCKWLNVKQRTGGACGALLEAEQSRWLHLPSCQVVYRVPLAPVRGVGMKWCLCLHCPGYGWVKMLSD